MNDGQFMEVKVKQNTAIDFEQAVKASGYASFEKGSICYYNGSYYIAKNTVSVSTSSTPTRNPEVNTNEWIKLKTS